jgi:hypothetical protein
MPFYRRNGSGTFHSKKECSRVPGNVEKNALWTTLKSRPKKGSKCVECTSKDRKK